ncbi:MAG: amidohydrolase [Anaerolineae bacterium]|jgi:predicted TIM-barrel fold metal-dependent hydrolase|nr:amidohydrolase [Anaerolineae bacterium]
MDIDLTPTDERIYREILCDFLPADIVDAHTHIWLRSAVLSRSNGNERNGLEPERTVSWPNLVAEDNAIDDLLETYRLLLPGKRVTPVVFGSPRQDIDLAATNAYVSESARSRALPSLLVSTPAWSAQDLEQRVLDGRFVGLKPYLSFAPPEIPPGEIAIYDYLPHSHLEVADAHGWVVMLHIPRPARLRDPVNVAQLLEIDRSYRNVRLIVAHIGRAYCSEDVGDALEVLGKGSSMSFDFSANTNAWVMKQLIRAVGPKRVLFGSDLPILRMRMRRICENGRYVNLVPPGLYGDISADPHMREVSPDEGERLTFFMYEELRAFRESAEATGLTQADLGDVFHNNATRLFGHE